MKPITMLSALVLTLCACTDKSMADDLADSTGTSDSGVAEAGGTGCETGTGDGDGDGDGDEACASSFITFDPPDTPAQLPIASDEVYPLPLGGYLRFIERDGAETTVLIFAGLSGKWSSAASYLHSIDTTTILPTSNLAIVEMLNPFGLSQDNARIDPDLFTPEPGESNFVTWGWWVWVEGDDPYDPASPGAYPILIETGDTIEAIVGHVDVFVQLGKEAGSREFGCGAGSPYDCNGHTVMAFGDDSYLLAEDIAGELAVLEPSWSAWDLDHPLGIIYDEPGEGEDRWLGTAAQWARVTWGSRAVEIIFPTNSADPCAPLLPGEPSPAAWPADPNYRKRTSVERSASVAAALAAVSAAI